MLEVTKEEKNYFYKLLVYFLVIIVFLPALLYRFAIKSTAWLWFPLIYIQRGVSVIATKPFIEKQEFISNHKNLWFYWLLRAYSIIYIMGVIISGIAPQLLSQTPYMPYAAFFGFFENYHPSWFQLLGFISAVLNLSIYFFCVDVLYNHVKNEEDLKRHEKRFKTFITLLRVSFVLFLLIILFGFLGFMFLKTDMPWHNAPDYFVDIINYLLVKPINLKFWS